MRKAILLSVFNKIDDLACHLEILKYNPYNPEIIIAWLKHDIEPPKGYKILKVDAPGFYLGPLLSLTQAIKYADKEGIDYICFRNADDHLFRHEMTENIFQEMHKSKLIAAGYNWLSVNSMDDFAMNELFVHVPSFAESVEDAEKLFLESSKNLMCEFKIAKWLAFVLKNNWSKFYRIPGRERKPGVGHDAWSIHWLYEKLMQKPVPNEIWKEYVNNNRFFNRSWQLIGSHSNSERLEYWQAIRNDVPYREELEKSPHFARWLEAAANHNEWNLPNSTDHIETRAAGRKNLPKMLVRV